MERQVIEAEPRNIRGKNEMRRLRQAGRVPAVLYGAGKETLSLSVNLRSLRGVLRAGQNEIFELRVQNGQGAQAETAPAEITPAMIVESQREPVKETLLHLDFHRIAMDRKLEVSVAVVLQGEPAGVKQQGGILEQVLREVEVECLPVDIPARITLDVSALMLNDSIRIEDIQAQLGDKVQLLQDAHAVVCHVVTPRAVEEEKPAEEAAAAAPAEPEVIKKGKAVEGEEAPEAGEKEEKKKKEKD
jgi:large subunit ribosomal protein L25